MDSAKNKKNYIKVTPHKSIYIGKKEIKSKMCNRIKPMSKSVLLSYIIIADVTRVKREVKIEKKTQKFFF